MEEKDVKETLNEVKEKAEEIAGKAAVKAGELNEKFKESEAGKKLLGEDGKLGKEDVDRLLEGAKKSVLGEDGKFDGEDVRRIADNAKEGLSKLTDKVKDLIDKD